MSASAEERPSEPSLEYVVLTGIVVGIGLAILAKHLYDTYLWLLFEPVTTCPL